MVIQCLLRGFIKIRHIASDILDTGTQLRRYQAMWNMNFVEKIVGYILIIRLIWFKFY